MKRLGATGPVGRDEGMKTERALTSKRPTQEIEQLVSGLHGDPHRILGVHGTTVRAVVPLSIKEEPLHAASAKGEA